MTNDKNVWTCGPNGGYAFGENFFGVLGTGSEEWSLQQKTLVGVRDGAMGTESEYLENIIEIAAGWMHSLALDMNDSVWSWGWNSHGQLGVDDDQYRTTPVQVLRGLQAQDPCEPSDYLKHIIDISAGRNGRHSLAVDADGYAYGWGYNKYGQCGNDANECDELTPVYVCQGQQPDDPNDPNDRLKHIVDICAGADQSIALEKDDPADPNFSGCVYTWGTNRWGDDPWDEGIVSLGYGLLGTASGANFSDTPVKVFAGAQASEPNQQYLNHIVAVAAGWDHCLALEKDDPYDPNIYYPTYTGRVYAWGNNGPGWGGGSPVGWERSVGGRLGNGTYTDSNVPALVLSGEQDPSDTNSYLEHIVAISAGEGHSMALDNKGNIYTWGDNQYGQLGNGCNDPGKIKGFAFSENGDEACLRGADADVLTGYCEIERFGATYTGVSIGRYFKTSTRNYNFVAMDYITPGERNSYPAVGPVVISEIMYNPDWPVGGTYGNDLYEYIRLSNITSSNVSLWREDKGLAWKFSGGIDFVFGNILETVTIPGGDHIYVVRDPNAFCERYPNVALERIFGPYDGQLSNSGEQIEISMPGDTDKFGRQYYIRVDRVNYSDGSHAQEVPGGVDLWPLEADGGGSSLSRVVLSLYGNDPNNWTSSVPSHGGS